MLKTTDFKPTTSCIWCRTHSSEDLINLRHATNHAAIIKAKQTCYTLLSFIQFSCIFTHLIPAISTILLLSLAMTPQRYRACAS